MLFMHLCFPVNLVTKLFFPLFSQVILFEFKQIIRQTLVYCSLYNSQRKKERKNDATIIEVLIVTGVHFNKTSD